jgi:hypothetical protein
MIGSNMSQMALDEAPTRAARPGARRSARYGGALVAVLWLAAAGSLATAAPPTATPAATPAVTPAVTPATPPAATPGTSTAPPAGGTGASSGDGAGVPAAAAGTGEPGARGQAGETRGLDQDIQGLKKDVVDLNRDLFILEEELLFPANTQVAVFLSVDVGDFFALDSVQLKIDKKEVINYLYTPREVDALLKGGVQRLYLGNLKVGPHELVAFFSGKGPNDRDYRRGASLRFQKSVGAKYLELKIDDRQRRLQPEFEIKDWE